MAQYKVPDQSQLVDQQFIQIQGPDGLYTGFQYDEQTRTLYAKESQVIIPAFHGATHVAEDPVPEATTDTRGLMSASDKAKLEALTQTRLGILGFSGAGFPDDGGYLEGDVILASGNETLSIERIGNVIRFTVDTPLPLNCNCEECSQIFWIQDESDTTAIRPPSCSGKLPGINGYGELKIYQLPKNTVVNPSSPLNVLNQKGNYPALIFKRYDDAVTPSQAEFELILSRNSNTTTRVGWAMTPGATGTAECVWFMGLDDDGNQIRFELDLKKEPDLLGQILYKGHTITRQMAVITDYTSVTLSTNQYRCKFWSVNKSKVVGDEFTATNVWRYNNPGNSATQLLNPQALVLDATSDILPVGTLVQIWEFQIGEVNGERLVQRFFSHQPKLNPGALWGLSDVIRFGDLLTTRSEIPGVQPTELTASETNTSDIRLFERTKWGITGFEDRLILSDDGELTASTDAGQVIISDSVMAIDTVGDPSGNVTPNFIITANSANTTAASSFTLNGLVGRKLVLTSGGLQGVEFEILENSASTLTLYDPDGVGAGITVGVTFDIYIATDTNEPSGLAINNQYVADIDPSLPGLRVDETGPQSDQERPVWLWHRGNHKNIYLKALVGRPGNSRFPPIDIVLRAPIDNIDDRYMKVVRRGTFNNGPFNGNNYVVVKGIHWHDLPPRGVVRILTGKYRNQTWEYSFKAAFDRFDDDAVVLIGAFVQFPFDGDAVPEVEGTGATDLDGPTGTNATELETALAATVPDKTTVVQLLHEEYSAPCLRLEFSVNDNSGAESVQLQAKAGILDMSQGYELNLSGEFTDDFVRGFRDGTLSVSRIYTQDGFITTGTETPDAEPADFRVYDGGALPVPVNGETEKWNELKIMYRNGELWVWWNGLLVPPDPTASAALPTPVAVSTPYFPVSPLNEVGKVGLRLWPGATVREVEVRDQLVLFNEFTHGQLELTSGSGTA